MQSSVWPKYIQEENHGLQNQSLNSSKTGVKATVAASDQPINYSYVKHAAVLHYWSELCDEL